MRKNKKPKTEYVDDGRTVYDMNVEGFRWHDRKKKSADGVDLTRKEKRAIRNAAYLAYLPKLAIVLVAFGLTALLIYFWLS